MPLKCLGLVGLLAILGCRSQGPGSVEGRPETGVIFRLGWPEDAPNFVSFLEMRNLGLEYHSLDDPSDSFACEVHDFLRYEARLIDEGSDNFVLELSPAGFTRILNFPDAEGLQRSEAFGEDEKSILVGFEALGGRYERERKEADPPEVQEYPYHVTEERFDRMMASWSARREQGPVRLRIDRRGILTQEGEAPGWWTSMMEPGLFAAVFQVPSFDPGTFDLVTPPVAPPFAGLGQPCFPGLQLPYGPVPEDGFWLATGHVEGPGGRRHNLSARVDVSKGQRQESKGDIFCAESNVKEFALEEGHYRFTEVVRNVPEAGETQTTIQQLDRLNPLHAWLYLVEELGIPSTRTGTWDFKPLDRRGRVQYIQFARANFKQRIEHEMTWLRPEMLRRGERGEEVTEEELQKGLARCRITISSRSSLALRANPPSSRSETE